MTKKKLPMGYGKPSAGKPTKGGTTLRNPQGSPKGQFNG